MRIDLEPLVDFAERHKMDARKMKRHLEAVQVSHKHVLRRRKILIQRLRCGRWFVDRSALRMLEHRHARTTESERLARVEATIRTLVEDVEELKATVAI